MDSEQEEKKQRIKEELNNGYTYVQIRMAFLV